MLWSPVDQTGEEAIRTEIFNLLAILYSMERKQKLQMLNIFTRCDLVSEMIAIEVMFRELILGICRLGDPDSGTWSLQGAWRIRQTDAERIDTRKVKAALKGYGRAIEPWKTELRHKRIAHYSKDSPNLSTNISDIRSVLKKAVESFDLIMGARQEYTMRVGSQEKPINLRESIEV